MKKLLIAAFVCGVAFTFTSCKKDYTCTCTVSSQTLPIEIKKAKKADAEDACTAAETTYKIGDPNASCKLEAK